MDEQNILVKIPGGYYPDGSLRPYRQAELLREGNSISTGRYIDGDKEVVSFPSRWIESREDI